MTITNNAELKKAIASVNRSGKRINGILSDAMEFVYEQATGEARNSSPAMLLRASELVCAPRGYSRKRLDEFMLTYCGFEWVGTASKGSYKKVAEVSTLPELPAQRGRFWEYERTADKREFNLSAEAGKFVSRALKNKADADAIVNAIAQALKDADTASNGTVLVHSA